ncbi:MAG: thioredoxin domain-containing protein [Verrucomicrobia bacterium]|nr:thioredoxin domain-containing protein [Verrucomicrobiota bacterium]
MKHAALYLFAPMLALALASCIRKPDQPQTNSIVTTNATPTVHSHTNRLAHEKSPYLLQHAHNPVDWYAWGEEAFAKASAENKPIFLSIGYSTCHWCHVMERESFEDEKIGAFLNEHFVSIKVDREERPDVDKIYMAFVQSTTGSGGWPLNVFLTPDRKPFFGGTYFPPDDRYGRGSFLSVLEQIVKVWLERHGEVTASADEIHARLEAATGRVAASNVALTPEVLRRAGAMFKDAYDPRHGGFGSAPKFPQPSQPAFLLRYAKRFKDAEAARMVLHTCERMAAGGIHDQLGGGFARYSVDAEWLVPHFEKMLYDNAQLTQLYLDAHLVSSETRSDGVMEKSSDERNSPPALQHSSTPFASVAGNILAYVLRDMTHPEGGFYSAEDADSEGHEGKFYCWTHEELSKLLSPEEFNVAAAYFGITKEGNFVDHSHPTPLAGQNVLSIVNPEVTTADRPLLEAAMQKLRALRAKRIRPHLDDKILASWNGLMLGAFARAYAVLGDETYRNAAEKNVAFIQAKLWDGKAKTLYHRWRDGERDNVQLLEAYAFLLDGVIQLYEATVEAKHLDFAIVLAEVMIAKFHDSENGGLWQTAADATDLILRVKDDYDGAEPSGNSVATLALLKLAAITGRADFRTLAEATLRMFATRLEKIPQAVPYMLHALDFWLEEPHRVVMAGDPHSAKAHDLIHAAHAVYQPNKVVLGNSGAVEEFAKSLPAQDGPVVYLCTGNACQPPTDKPAMIQEMLR